MLSEEGLPISAHMAASSPLDPERGMKPSWGVLERCFSSGPGQQQGGALCPREHSFLSVIAKLASSLHTEAPLGEFLTPVDKPRVRTVL